ncbi:hypothetical protein ABZ694_25005 [Streptomyces albidoflavus]|uniref:hypothetical protein n=1 Tax=Streptomyces albidoflavus TaxID=1886 RepID=UPI0033F48EEE
MLPAPHHDEMAWMQMEHEDSVFCPGPQEDPFLRHISEDEFCAFVGEEPLYVWFSGYCAKLKAAGYVIRVYDVPDADVRCGRRGQAAFKMGSAEERDVRPILERFLGRDAEERQQRQAIYVPASKVAVMLGQVRDMTADKPYLAAVLRQELRDALILD